MIQGKGEGGASAGGLSRGRNFLSPFELLAGACQKGDEVDQAVDKVTGIPPARPNP